MPDEPGQPFAHDENMQAFEYEDKILIAIVDETYGRSDEEDWQSARERFRLSLEDEYGLRFEDGNVGPGADLPVFLTLLESRTLVPTWTLIVSAFFLGKPICDNVEAWSKIGRKLRAFLKRPAFLNRQGTSILAVEAISEAIGKIPSTLQLISYRTTHISDPVDSAATEISTGIADPLPTLYLGFIRHIFEIEADGEIFRVSVDGTKTELSRPTGESG